MRIDILAYWCELAQLFWDEEGGSEHTRPVFMDGDEEAKQISEVETAFEFSCISKIDFYF
jgi:hypothetical protein